MKLVLILMTITTTAHAGDYKQFFLVGGKQTDAQAAIVATMKGQEAFKCQSVEFKVSKAGTSIGLKNIKKPKAN